MKVKLEVAPGADGFIRRNSLRSVAPWSGPPHSHNELELNLVTQGSAVCVIGNRRHALGPNCLLWIFPGQEHIVTRESPDFEAWVAVFTRAQVRRISAALERPILTKLRPIGHFCRIVDSNAASLLSRFMEEMLREKVPLAQFNTSMDWLLMEAWRRFESSSDLPLNADIHPAVQRLAAILREDSGTPTLDEMSRRVGMSPAWLSRLFQSQMKISIPAFRNRQRLAAFLALYRRGGRYNLTQAALEAGFQSYLQFYRVFISLMGITPRQFAASRRQDNPADFPVPENDCNLVPPRRTLVGRA